MTRFSLNTKAYEDDFGRFFCKDSVKSLQNIEEAMNVAVESFTNLSNPFNVFAFPIGNTFFTCQVETVLDRSTMKLVNLLFTVKPMIETLLFSKDKEFSEKFIKVEFQIPKKGLKVKSFILSTDNYWFTTSDENQIFARFTMIRSELYRYLLDTVRDTSASLNYDAVEEHINDYFFYQSLSMPDMKKHFDRSFRQEIKRNQTEWFNYRNTVEEKEKLLSGVNLLNPDELGLNVLSMVCGIDYPEFLARHFAKTR